MPNQAMPEYSGSESSSPILRRPYRLSARPMAIMTMAVTLNVKNQPAWYRKALETVPKNPCTCVGKSPIAAVNRTISPADMKKMEGVVLRPSRSCKRLSMFHDFRIGGTARDFPHGR